MASLEPFSLASKNVRAFTAINNIPRIRTSCVPLSHFPLQLSRSGLTTIFSYFQNSRKFGEKLKAKSLIAVLCAGLTESISRVSATNNEEANARTAAATANTGAPTMVLAFRDINLQAPVHVILIPPEGLTELGKAEAQQRDILGKLLYAAKIVAEKEGILDGFPVVINSGPTACQSVYHLHLHVLGGRQMKWPPG